MIDHKDDSFVARLLRAIGLKQDPPDSPPVIRLKELPDGRLRFETFATNNYQDRQGEFFPAAAHEEYIEWAEKTGGYPELWPWHQYGQRLGVVDVMAFDGNFLVSSGLIDVGMEAKAKAWAEDPEIAMSHGFFKRQRGQDIVQYREFEQSVLPRWAAANPWTDFTVGAKEMALSPAGRQKFAEKGYTPEEIAALESHTEAFRKNLEKIGVQFKDLDDDSTPGAPAPVVAPVVAQKDDAPPAPAPAPPAPAPTPGSPGFTLDDVRQAVREELSGAMKEINEVKASLKSFEGNADEYFASLWQSRAGAPVIRPSQNPDTTVTGGQKAQQEDKHAWINNVPLFEHPIMKGGRL